MATIVANHSLTECTHEEDPVAYLTLFLTAFAAATLLPAYSEILLGTLLAQGLSPWWLWFWATLGNTLGSVVNGIIGRQVIVPRSSIYTESAC